MEVLRLSVDYPSGLADEPVIFTKVIITLMDNCAEHAVIITRFRLTINLPLSQRRERHDKYRPVERCTDMSVNDSPTGGDEVENPLWVCHTAKIEAQRWVNPAGSQLLFLIRAPQRSDVLQPHRASRTVGIGSGV